MLSKSLNINNHPLSQSSLTAIFTLFPSSSIPQSNQTHAHVIPSKLHTPKKMFQAYFVAALCIVLASVSQIQAASEPISAATSPVQAPSAASGAVASSGKTCSQAWLPPRPNTSDKGIICVGGGEYYVCQRSGVAQAYSRKVPNGKTCTKNGSKIPDQVCRGGFQAFYDKGFTECFTTVDRASSVHCKTVEAMFAAGGECDKWGTLSWLQTHMIRTCLLSHWFTLPFFLSFKYHRVCVAFAGRRAHTTSLSAWKGLGVISSTSEYHSDTVYLSVQDFISLLWKGMLWCDTCLSSCFLSIEKTRLFSSCDYLLIG